MPLNKQLCVTIMLTVLAVLWLVLLSPISEPARRAYVKDCAPICLPFGATEAGGYSSCHCNQNVIVRARKR